MIGWRRLLPVALPLLIAGVVAWLVRAGWLPNFLYTLSLRFNLPGLVWRLALLTTGVALLWAAMLLWNDHRLSQARRADADFQNAARRDFLRRLDHELKNPLTIIHLGASNLRQDSQITPRQAASLQRIVQQSQRLQKLIVDLRWLTELDEGNIEQSSVDLADVLDEAILLAKEGMNYEDRQVTLNIQQTPWPLNPVRGDRELLVVSFRNLLENAFKYTTDTDRIEVRATENGQMAMIEVADSGRGIAEQEQELIFQNLYRSQDARDMPGRGLGLPLVQQIVNLHHGRISVRSRPQTGTVFTVWLPLFSS